MENRIREPLVSVAMTVYNGEKYLAEAIESILGQTYSNFEIIFINDGSVDSTEEIARRFAPPVLYFYQKHSGQGAGRNMALRQAKGDFFAFLDADDLWVKEKLTIQMNYLKKHPEMDMVFGKVKQFYSPELSRKVGEGIGFTEDATTGIIPSAMLVRKPAFLKTGWFGEGLQLTDFAAWYVKSRELGLRVGALKDLVAMRRIHGSNIGILRSQHLSDYAALLKAHLDWQRKGKSK